MNVRNAFENPKNRQAILVIGTGLVVAYVRHGIEKHWSPWDSIEQFLTYWFVHTAGLVVLIAFVAMAVIWLHKFFLGYERENYADELTFDILMTVLVTSVCIAFLAHWTPAGEFEF